MEFEEIRVDFADMVGALLPSVDWVDIPGSPLQARTNWTDPFGTFWVRVKPKETDETVP